MWRRHGLRQSDLGASRTMLDRKSTVSACGRQCIRSAENLAWLVDEKEIASHIPVFDKPKRTDDTFSRSDFTWQAEKEQYLCPAGKELKQFHRPYDPPRSGIKGTRLYRASNSHGIAERRSKCSSLPQGHSADGTVAASRTMWRESRIPACHNGAEPEEAGQTQAPDAAMWSHRR